MFEKMLCPQQQANTLDDLQRLWAFRAILDLDGLNQLVNGKAYRSDSLAKQLGLEPCTITKHGKKGVKDRIKAMMCELEAQPLSLSSQSLTLRENITEFARVANLDSDCVNVLEFIVHLHSCPQLETLTDHINVKTLGQVCSQLATLLRLSPNAVKQTLRESSRLHQTGLIEYSTYSEGLCGRVNIPNESVIDVLYDEQFTCEKLLEHAVTPAPHAVLKAKDYEHLCGDVNIMLNYLRNKSQGCNILLYGPPGTGKTQLARLIADMAERRLFEVATEGENHKAIEGYQRMQRYKLGQNLLDAKSSILLFDEIEDIFEDGGLFMPSTASRHKAWMNNMLETNPIPTFWLSNCVHGMDPAYLRRFDIVIEVPIPSIAQRKRIIKRCCMKQLSAATIDILSQRDDISPALLARTSDVTSTITTGKTAEKIYLKLLNQSLKVMGLPKVKIKNANQANRELYSLSYLNTNTDISQLLTGLKRNPDARICLYGPPGTGKTAICNHIAHSLKKPLHAHKVSDLMSMYVGQSERNIANAFAKAQNDGAVLILDEVDSFLRDRNQASNSWETTLVNEMLTQMESYDGIFFASTNLMSNLDKAALRRFDLKVEFSYLLPDQAEALFTRYAKALNLSGIQAQHRISVRALNNLAPGDFAAVYRRHRFSPLTSIELFIESIRAECNIKQPESRPIGFI
tara:strand:+ start:70 stop:2127 length:2058 start_codon:yes stop_codon:yes gene_type:complete